MIAARMYERKVSTIVPGSAASITAADYAQLLALMGELAEILDAASESAVDALVERLCRLLGGAALLFMVMRRGDGASPGSSTPSWTEERSVLHGLDEAQSRTWRAWWLESEAYSDHPFMLAMQRRAGVARTNLRRDLVDDRTWYRSPHIGDFCRALGYDDVIASALPVGPQHEVFVSAARPWGDRRFSPREAGLIAALQPHLAWFYRRHLLSPAPQLAGTAAGTESLPRRLRAVAMELRTGASEKEIAAQLELSPRTVHKYVEQIYRTVGVRSRAELMARWLSSSPSGSPVSTASDEERALGSHQRSGPRR